MCGFPEPALAPCLWNLRASVGPLGKTFNLQLLIHVLDGILPLWIKACAKCCAEVLDKGSKG